MTHETAVNILLERYREIFERKRNGEVQNWACKKESGEELIRCSIPFVGKRYFEQPVKILVYASAENLNHDRAYLENDSFAENRHRICFEKSLDGSDAFPNLHIQPFNNGALVLVACHVMSKLTEIGDCSPSEFLETIACANYGKYTVDPRKKGVNTDYAKDPSKLGESQDYIRADIEILRPDYIIMVRQMYEGLGKQKNFIDGIKGNAEVIPIYQITPTTINNPRTFRKYPPAKLENLHPTIQRWYPHFHAGAVSSPYFLSVFAYLDDVCRKNE